MAFSITDSARSALEQTAKEPNIVFEIEGYNTIFGAAIIEQYVRIGGTIEEPDPDLPEPIVGDPELEEQGFYIGGFAPYERQENIITFQGTSTSIRQTLTIDKAEGSSISSLSVALIDDGFVTKLITPSEILDDVLYKKAIIYYGFQGTAWPEDYVTVFRGFITDVQSGANRTVVFQVSHPEEKKRSNIFKKVEAETVGALTNSVTTIILNSAANILSPVTGPDGLVDPSFECYVRVDDEIIRFTGVSGNQLTGCVRGSLGTEAAPHEDQASVETFYLLKGNALDLALKLMSSGFQGPWVEQVKVTAFNTNGLESVDNALFFEAVDVTEKYGLVVGDYVSVVDSDFGSNDFSLKKVLGIVYTPEGSTVSIGEVALTSGFGNNALASFRSQYDTLPDGLRMGGDEIDVLEHLRLRRLFLSGVNYTIYLKDTIENAKEFIEKQIYSPAACFSIPRKARSSIGYHIGPIPGQNIKVFDATNIKNPSSVRVRRSVNRNFYNEIVYKFDEDALEDKFLTGYIGISATSKNRIKGANKTLQIEAKGLRSFDEGETIAAQQALRRLKRYEFGAETISFEVLMKDGFEVEIGDIVIVDGSELSIPDIKTGQRGMKPRFFEVQNKDFQLKTGDVKLEAVDTAFLGSSRYGLVSPSSLIKAVISQRQIVIESSFASQYGVNEWRKWSRFQRAKVRVRNSDFSISSTEFFDNALMSSNTITLKNNLPFTPTIGMVMELAPYSEQPEEAKLVFGFASDGTNDFQDGKPYFGLL